MNLKKLTAGKNAPEEVNVLIEIPMNGGPIKYEFDKELEMIVVDRFMQTTMSYPCNYGFIPNTLSGDGDPADVLVYSNYPITPGALVKARPIGVLMTEDEKGMDEKILAVPASKIDPFFDGINSYKDLPELAVQKIEHFFENYKKLEKGKWVKVSGWKDAKEAKEIIKIAIDAHNKEAA